MTNVDKHGLRNLVKTIKDMELKTCERTYHDVNQNTINFISNKSKLKDFLMDEFFKKKDETYLLQSDFEEITEIINGLCENRYRLNNDSSYELRTKIYYLFQTKYKHEECSVWLGITSVIIDRIANNIVKDIIERKKPFDVEYYEFTIEDIVNVIMNIIDEYASYITHDVKYTDKYFIKPDVNDQIDIIKTNITTLTTAILKEHLNLVTKINNNNFVYLGVRNTFNCTINALFHMLINYAIMTDRFNMENSNLSEDELNIVLTTIETYIKDWFMHYKECFNNQNSNIEVKKREYNKLKLSTIKNILELTIKNNKLDLRYFVCYYAILHLWIYCECALDVLYNNSTEEDDMSLYALGYNALENMKNNETKNENYNLEAIVNTQEKYVHFSDRIGNQIFKLFYNKLNGDEPEKVQLYNNLKDSPVKHNVLKKTFDDYNNCFAKYFDGAHADVILFKRSGLGKVDHILIDDTKLPNNKKDPNDFNCEHVVVGIYVVSRIPLSEFEDRAFSDTPEYHMPTALFFKGGAFIPILFIICIVVIVVCVVIYIHDHYWFKPQAQSKAIPKI